MRDRFNELQLHQSVSHETKIPTPPAIRAALLTGHDRNVGFDLRSDFWGLSGTGLLEQSLLHISAAFAVAFDRFDDGSFAAAELGGDVFVLHALIC